MCTARREFSFLPATVSTWTPDNEFTPTSAASRTTSSPRTGPGEQTQQGQPEVVRRAVVLEVPPRLEDDLEVHVGEGAIVASTFELARPCFHASDRHVEVSVHGADLDVGVAHQTVEELPQVPDLFGHRTGRQRCAAGLALPRGVDLNEIDEHRARNCRGRDLVDLDASMPRCLDASLPKKLRQHAQCTLLFGAGVFPVVGERPA